MIYIPREWLKDKENMDKVYEILNKLDTDIKYDNNYAEDNAILELKEIGESDIVEKLSNGFFMFGA